MAKKRRKQPVKHPRPVAATTLAWEEDPGSGAAPISVGAPDPAAGPLAYRFPAPAPKPREYAPGTAAFRYWVAVEALRRGADYWASRVPGGRWQMGATLAVKLDAGVDLNAYYDRRALNFFHDRTADGMVYSGESPDVLCHEMGHAILDSVKPGLWDAASHEVAAFHESFGDMSAILGALQLPSLRRAILADTGGRLYRSSRLSRLAEQLGAAIRAQHPDAVDRDCLRNAVNSFAYQDPLTLPTSAPAAQLSAEPHSFSRVFTAAFFEALGGMLAALAAKPAAPTEQELLQASHAMGDVLIAGIRSASIVPDFYAEVAGSMVQAATEGNAGHAAALRSSFTRRGILPAGARTPSGRAPARVPRSARRVGPEAPALEQLALDVGAHGLRPPRLRVTLASQPRAFAPASATVDSRSPANTSAVAAAHAFVEDLFRRGRIDLGRRQSLLAVSPHTLKSHQLVAAGGELALQRRLFDCGCRG
ncbi:MAG: hypothetical protein U1F30_02455 [Steroidobacteraceae bacterium]